MFPLTRFDRICAATAAFISVVLVLAILFAPKPAKSAECPPGTKSCKVIVVTPEQENILDQLITQTCIAGPYAQIAEVVKFYKEMLAKAPPGTAPAESKK